MVTCGKSVCALRACDIQAKKAACWAVGTSRMDMTECTIEHSDVGVRVMEAAQVNLQG